MVTDGFNYGAENGFPPTLNNEQCLHPMIDQFTDQMLRRYARFPIMTRPARVACIGDQQVCPSLKFKDAQEYFRSALGYSDHIDIDYNGKAKINHDLNLPISGCVMDICYSWSALADLVYDGGTLEHVCNAGQALKTMAQMVKVGGLIVQESPIVPYGQAYWGVSPLVQRDFFRAAGFQDVAHIVHYRKSWKMDLLHAIVTRIPKRMADRLADRVRRIPGAKETIFGHDWRDEYVYPDSAWRDRHAFYPHPQTRSMYIGRKVREVGTVVWPQMECYPSKP